VLSQILEHIPPRRLCDHPAAFCLGYVYDDDDDCPTGVGVEVVAVPTSDIIVVFLFFLC